MQETLLIPRQYTQERYQYDLLIKQSVKLTLVDMFNNVTLDSVLDGTAVPGRNHRYTALLEDLITNYVLYDVSLGDLQEISLAFLSSEQQQVVSYTELAIDVNITFTERHTTSVGYLHLLSSETEAQAYDQSTRRLLSGALDTERRTSMDERSGLYQGHITNSLRACSQIDSMQLD